MKDLAEKIVKFAFKDKVDLAGEPYINHLKRVAEKVSNPHRSSEIEVVALLHDLIEDCPDWNIENLKCFFYHTIVDAVEALTKRDGEEYEDYISRVQENNYAAIVKIADLQDNMDITRLKEITPKDVKRLKKYLNAYKFLK